MKEMLIRLAFTFLLGLSKEALEKLIKYAAVKCDAATERGEFSYWCAVADFLEVLLGRKEVVND